MSWMSLSAIFQRRKAIEHRENISLMVHCLLHRLSRKKKQQPLLLLSFPIPICVRSLLSQHIVDATTGGSAVGTAHHTEYKYYNIIYNTRIYTGTRSRSPESVVRHCIPLLFCTRWKAIVVICIDKLLGHACLSVCRVCICVSAYCILNVHPLPAVVGCGCNECTNYY